MKRIIKWLFELHDIDDLQTSSTCGCCGKGHSDVVEKVWPYSVCRKCIVLAHDFNPKARCNS